MTTLSIVLIISGIIIGVCVLAEVALISIAVYEVNSGAMDE